MVEEPGQREKGLYVAAMLHLESWLKGVLNLRMGSFLRISSSLGENRSISRKHREDKASK